MSQIDDNISVLKWIMSLLTFSVALLVLGLWGCPKYTVYNQRMAGEAEYAQAQYNTKVKQLESQAAESSAISLAAADTIRAHGVATSNQIIGNSLKDNEAYLTWLYIDGLKDKDNSIIYIPTEAGLPVLEANRLNHLPHLDSLHTKK